MANRQTLDFTDIQIRRLEPLHGAVQSELTATRLWPD